MVTGERNVRIAILHNVDFQKEIFWLTEEEKHQQQKKTQNNLQIWSFCIFIITIFFS